MANNWFKKTAPDTVLPAPEHLEYVDDGAAAVLLSTPTRAKVLLWACFLFFMSAIIWAAWAELDEVTSGQGKVIPSRQLQVVQNLEGGIVKQVFVREGQVVHQGQELMQIDDTRFRSDFREREQEIISLKGDVARLRAELSSLKVINDPKLNWREQIVVSSDPIVFPDSFANVFPDEAKRQNSAYMVALNNLNNELSIMGQQIEQKENEIFEINNRIQTLGRSVDLARSWR